jgi:ankyrin repeat protein
MLSFDEFNKGCCHPRKEFRARLQQFPAFNYAAHNWGYHARDEKEETTREIVLDSESVFGGYDQPFTRNVTGLHVASFFGLVNAVNDLVMVSFEPDCKDSRGSTPLFYSARNGHLKVVEKLLAANADVNAATAATISIWTALQAAAQGDHLEVVEKLLAANADINAAAAAAAGGHTTLQAAAQGGHLEVVERLLIANADVNAAAAAADDDDSHTALQAAALGGHLEVVERLLAANADVNAAAAGGGHTALQAANQGGHLEVVRVLKWQDTAGSQGVSAKKPQATTTASKKRF